MDKFIKIIEANEHNLKNISVSIEKNKITAVTGVSGSGKSSLIYDILYKEGFRQFFSSYSVYVRQFLKSMGKANVKEIQGLTPVIALKQQQTEFNSRSTVGTISGIYDLLRLLFARKGTLNGKKQTFSKSLFSFNSLVGACPHCKGLGIEEKIDIEKLIADENKTLREGALTLSTGNKGYIMYSQVTIDVLDSVCKAHGFSVDIPFKNLTKEQKNIVFYGSNKLKVPFGKHDLNSRLKWSGITAKPREEGYYKGIIPVMEEILKRDRNKNILKYTYSKPCSKCDGTRLCEKALEVKFNNKNIYEFATLTIKELYDYFFNLNNKTKDNVLKTISSEIYKKTKNICELGMPYLTLMRETHSLSGGEQKRLKLANFANSEISNVTYIFDEPTTGLHLRDTKKLVNILEQIRNRNNTVIVVEHNKSVILNSEKIVDIGLLAGENGGNVIFEGSVKDFLNSNVNSKTKEALLTKNIVKPKEEKEKQELIKLYSLNKNNLKNISPVFKKNCLNTITGVSGSGKSSLIYEIYNLARNNQIEGIDNVVYIDQSPIGKTSRSNPATYTKLFDKIRNLFASLESAKVKKLNKSSFSFNVKGGRCEVCEGAGVISIGMHYLGNVETTCNTCNGKRFKDEILEITYKGKNIADILNLKISDAIQFFSEEKDILHILKVLDSLGLSYLTLGQSSSTLSGGEGMRIKLASYISKKTKGHTLFLFDEPTTGLHPFDVKTLLNTFKNLLKNNNTIITVEHDSDVILNSDHIVDLGPESDKNGGEIVFSGSPFDLIKCKNSITGNMLANEEVGIKNNKTVNLNTEKKLELKGVSTNNLKNIDVTINHNQFTVVTGVSGAGKSSLCYDTIYTLARNSFLDYLPNYQKSLINTKGEPSVETVKGLIPVITLKPVMANTNARSTVGTFLDIYSYFRLLFARFGTVFCPKCNLMLENGKCKCGFEYFSKLTTSHFSFNDKLGACENCKGLGFILSCDPEKLITNRELPLIDGAMNGTKVGKFYSEKEGQFVAILKAVANKYNLDYSKPIFKLSKQEFEIAMFGTKEEEFNVNWEYNRKGRKGTHNFKTIWKGFVNLVNEEFLRKQGTNKEKETLPLMSEYKCNVCNGTRLKKVPSFTRFNNKTIYEVCNLKFNKLTSFINSLKTKETEEIFDELENKTKILIELGLEHLTTNTLLSSLTASELQRIRLSSSLFSNLSGVMYILDEPTTSLNKEEVNKLIKIIDKLKQNGNTVLAVDHNKYLIEKADKIIELGKEGGKLGGFVVFEGDIKALKSHKETETYKMLYDKLTLNENFNKSNQHIEIKNIYNLKTKQLKIPLLSITNAEKLVNTKHTALLFDILTKSFENKKPFGCEQVKGFETIKNVVLISPKTTKGNSTSSIATYLKLLNLIKTHFANTKESKMLGLKPNAFLYNSKAGYCSACKGTGKKTTSLDFISDITTSCEECNGLRYNQTVLKCKLNGLSIGEVLMLSVNDAISFFSFDKKITKTLQTLESVGLGYLTLGQQTSTLSTGENLRLNLANSLINQKQNNTLYLLDQITRGLFYSDTLKIFKLMENLVKDNNTVIYK